MTNDGNIEKEFGPYHRLYEASETVWNGHVGLMVQTFAALFPVRPAGRVLDLGGGEGDNALYLAQRGHTVHVVERSPAAMRNFQRKANQVPSEVAARIHWHCGDVRQPFPVTHADVVIAYGLLHCFRSRSEAEQIARHALGVLGDDGVLIVSSLTADLPADGAHPELAGCFFPSEVDFDGWFDGLVVCARETERFEERHGDGPWHQHQVLRAIYRR